jgi:NAD(P)-dependent dehydrogenase (short-subunit alcohol dehydrogenase family)
MQNTGAGCLVERDASARVGSTRAGKTSGPRTMRSIRQRVGRPEDVAELVTYLLSERSGFVTGANIEIDGGMTRKMIHV